MNNSIFTDDAMKTARAALDGLSLRQQTISRNMANIDTPGYKAQDVCFENVLDHITERRNELSIDKTNPAHLSSAAERTGFTLSDRPGGSERADGNNVDIDLELVKMSESGIRFQALIETVNKKSQLLKFITMSR